MTAEIVYLRKDTSVVFNGLTKQQMILLAVTTSIYANPPRQVSIDTLGLVPLHVIQEAISTLWKRQQQYQDVLSDVGVDTLRSLPKAFTALVPQLQQH